MPQAKSARTGEKPPREAPPAWAEKLKAGLQWMAELDAARPGLAAPRRAAVKAAARAPETAPRRTAVKAAAGAPETAPRRAAAGASGTASPRGCTPDRPPEPAAPPCGPSPAPSPEIAAPAWIWDDIPPIDLSAFEPLEPSGPPAAGSDPEVLEDGFELIEEPEDPCRRQPLLGIDQRKWLDEQYDWLVGGNVAADAGAAQRPEPSGSRSAPASGRTAAARSSPAAAAREAARGVRPTRPSSAR